MTSVIANTESASSQINTWLNALSTGESAQSIGQSDNSLESWVTMTGDGIQLGANYANAIEVMSDYVSGLSGIGGSGLTFVIDYVNAAEMVRDNTPISITLASSLASDVTGLIANGLLTGIAAAQATGAATVATAIGVLELPVALGIAAAAGTAAVILGAVGLLTPATLSSIANSASSFLGLNLSDQSSDSTLPSMAVTTSSQPDITSTSADGTVVDQTWLGGADTYTEVTTYTSSDQMQIASQVMTDENSATGQTTVTTINYNPTGTECTFNQTVSPSSDPDSVVGSVSGTETPDGVVQTLNVSGSGMDATASNAGVTLDDGTSATLSGLDSTIDLGNNDTLSLAASSDTLAVSGTGSMVTETGNDNVTTTTLSGNAFTLAGTDNQLQSSGSSIILAENSISDVDGDINTITALSGSSGTLTGSGDNVNVGGAGTAFTIGGNGQFSSEADNVNFASGITGTVDEAANSLVQVDGNGITVDAAGADTTGLAGTGSTLDVSGGSGFFYVGGNGEYAGGVDADNVNFAGGVGGTIFENANSLVQADGDGITVDAAGNDTTGLAGSDETLNVSGDSGFFYVGGNGQFPTSPGAYDNVNFASGISGTVLEGANSLVQVGGNDITVDAAAGDTTGLGGSGDSLNVSGSGGDFYVGGNGQYASQIDDDDVNFAGGITGTVYESADSWLQVGGNGISVNDYGSDVTGVGGSGDLINLLGTNDDIWTSGNTVNFDGADFSVGLVGSSDTVNMSAGSLTELSGIDSVVNMVQSSDSTTDLDDGSEATLYGAGNYVDIMGSNVTVYASGDTFSDAASGLTGVIVEGSDDDGDLSGDDYIDDGGTGGDGGYGYDGGGYYYGYGFSGNRSAIKSELTGSDIGSLAQYDLNSGNDAGAAAAEKGFNQAAEMAGDTATSSGTGPNVLEGARWSSDVITWSMADLPGNLAASFSGYMGAQYESEVEAAFAAWSAVTGLQFVEVADSSQTDIRIGWGDLDTASTGEVGLTTYRASGGVMSAGTVIELENPTQDALTGTGDQQTWAGSDATLYQTLLHEIGHALGLADNADPNSVMNYDLTSSNQQLDSTDVQAIQALYGSPSASAASSAQVEALIQAMAGYATSGSAQTTTTPTTDSADQALELAAAGH